MLREGNKKNYFPTLLSENDLSPAFFESKTTYHHKAMCQNVNSYLY